MNTYGRCPQSNKGMNHTLQKKYWFARQKLFGRKKSTKNSQTINGSQSSYKAIPIDDVYMDFSDSLSEKIDDFKNVKRFLENHLKIGKEYVKCLKKISSLESKIKEGIIDIASPFQDYPAKMAESACNCLETTSKAHESMAQCVKKFNEDLEIFHNKAIGDTSVNVDELNTAKDHLTAAFCWMNKVAKSVDSDTNTRITKFKGVKDEVKQQHGHYTRLCDVAIGKISLITVSNDNMIIRNINDYQRNLVERYEKSSIVCSAFNSQYKDTYVPYEFKFLKAVIGDNNGINCEPYPCATQETLPSSNNVDTVSDLIDLDGDDTTNTSSGESCYHDCLNSNDNNDLNDIKFFQSFTTLSIVESETSTNKNDSGNVSPTKNKGFHQNINTMNETSIETLFMENSDHKKDFESKQWDQFFDSFSKQDKQKPRAESPNFETLLESMDPVNRINLNTKNNDYC